MNSNEKQWYERHLPHQVPPGRPIFLTWNLKGALPQSVVAQLEIEKQKLETQKAKDFESIEDRKLRQAIILFAKRDRFLDTCNHGPLWLKDPFAAESVVRSLLWGTPHRYELFFGSSWQTMFMYC